MNLSAKVLKILYYHRCTGEKTEYGGHFATSRFRFVALRNQERMRTFVPNITHMKLLYILLGSLSLGLGVLGIFLPLLPTTPLLLLAAALYFRGSDRLYGWLMNHKRLGPYIRNFREHKAIPLRVKVISVTMVWVTILYSVVALSLPLYVKVFLLLLAAAISWHILSYKTLRRGDTSSETKSPGN